MDILVGDYSVCHNDVIIFKMHCESRLQSRKNSVAGIQTDRL